jgi:hydrogenase maturation protein HypF
VEILATGGELKNTFCFARGNQAFVSHHIGDLENLETLESFEKGIDHFRKIFYLDPQVVAYDMHPRYLSTQYALRYPAEMRFPVQHHHAHIVSVMAENNVEGPVIGVAWDGTGFGDDGHLWGSEFLVCTSEEYRRCGHLRYIPMPGGERAVREPWRMAAAYLDDALGPAMWELRIPFIEILREGNWQVLAAAVKKGIGSPLTSGAGRLFDAVSALAGICRTANYEGQAAIELETTACEEPAGPYAFDILDGDGFLIDARPVIRDVVRDLEGGVPVPVISRKFHETASDMIVEGALRVRAGEGLSTVALSGGVFQNVTLLESVINKLRRRGFTVVTHGRVPPNDGGISLGQAVVASARWKQCALGSR